MKNIWRTHSIGIFILTGLVATFVLADQMEMVTYYPAPLTSLPDPLYVGSLSVGNGYKNQNPLPVPPANGMMVEGNVGMGTINPAYSLDIRQTAPVTIHLTAGGNDDGSYIASTGVAGLNVMGGATFDGTNYVAKAANAGGFYVQSLSGNLGAWANTGLTPGTQVAISTRLFIQASNGNVGIGTITPQTLLDVNGAMTVQGSQLNLTFPGSRENPMWIMAGGTNALGFDSTSVNKHVYIGGPGWNRTVFPSVGPAGFHWFMVGGDEDDNKALGFHPAARHFLVGSGYTRTVLLGLDGDGVNGVHWLMAGGDVEGTNNAIGFHRNLKHVLIGSPLSGWSAILNIGGIRTKITEFDGDGWHWFMGGGDAEPRYNALGINREAPAKSGNGAVRVGPNFNLFVDQDVDVGRDLTVHRNAYGGPWKPLASDVRLKRNVEPIHQALEKLLQLRGVTFEWKDPGKVGETSGVKMGMVAQDVEKVFPDWVQMGPIGYKTFGYKGFEALTVEALRELKMQNEALKAENEELKSQIKELREKVDILFKNAATSSGR